MAYRTSSMMGVLRRGKTVQQNDSSDLTTSIKWFMTSDAGTVQVTFKDVDGESGGTSVLSCVPGVVYWGAYRRIFASTNTTATICAMGD